MDDEEVAANILEHEDLVVDLADGAGSGVLESLQVGFHGGDHGWGAANEDLGGRSRWGELLRDVFLANESNTSSPASRCVVQNVVDLETVGEHGNQVIELDTEKDIFLADVGVDESELGWVAGVEEGVADDLEHGSDTGSTSDEAEFLGEVGAVDELTLGALDADVVSDLELAEVLRNVAFLVGLDNQVKVSEIINAGGGGVAASDILALNLGGNRDVLPSGKAKGVLGVGEGESIESSVGRDDDLLLKGELLPCVGVEDGFTTVMLGLDKESEANADTATDKDGQTQRAGEVGKVLLHEGGHVKLERRRVGVKERPR